MSLTCKAAGIAVVGLLLAAAPASAQWDAWGNNPIRRSQFTTGSPYTQGAVAPEGFYFRGNEPPPVGGPYYRGTDRMWVARDYPLSARPLANTVFLTSINYPGIYGAHVFGAAPVTALKYTVPEIQTWNRIRAVTTPGVTDELRSTMEGRPGAALTAHVTVDVPVTARLWFNGVEMRQGGASREFVTPVLNPNRTYSYNVRASWFDGDQEVVMDKRIRVQPGRDVAIDMVHDTVSPRQDELRTTPSELRTRPEERRPQESEMRARPRDEGTPPRD
jgi:uncharacterized protein (TIGR03000 family)